MQGVERKTTYGRKKRPYRGKGQKGLTLAQRRQVSALVTKKIEVKAEKKTHDIELDYSIPISFSATNTLALSEIAEGSAYNQRIGERISPVGLFLRFQLKCVDSTNRIRIIIWRQALNNATVSGALTSVLEYTNVANVDRDIYSPYKTNTDVTKFKIFFDKNYDLTLNANNQSIIEEIYINLQKQPDIEFNSGATTGSGHYFISWISDSAAASHPTIGGWSRLRYLDM